MLDQHKNIKIVDFGLSNTFSQNELLKTACGSPCYAAPEMIAGKKYEGSKVDVWSSGVILYALICGFLPFEDPDTSKLYKKILIGEFHMPEFISKEAQSLISKILITDPAKRLRVKDIKRHDWFTQKFTPVCSNYGLVVGYTAVPIEPRVMAELEGLGFTKEYVEKCLDANKHNHATTCYYLLLQKYEQQGKI